MTLLRGEVLNGFCFLAWTVLPMHSNKVEVCMQSVDCMDIYINAWRSILMEVAIN